jgi:hypothetical protein
MTTATVHQMCMTRDYNRAFEQGLGQTNSEPYLRAAAT